jgi:hypothetical protein
MKTSNFNAPAMTDDQLATVAGSTKVARYTARLDHMVPDPPINGARTNVRRFTQRLDHMVPDGIKQTGSKLYR